MTSIVSSRIQTSPIQLSLYDHLLRVFPRLLDLHHGGQVYSATYIGSAVPSLHRYVVHLD